MSDRVTLSIDNVEIHGRPGQTVLEAADEAGIYIPRLCYLKGLEPFGSCRVCTVLVNGRPQAACTQPIAHGMVVESATREGPGDPQGPHRHAVRRRQPLLHVLREERQLRAAGAGLPVRDHRSQVPLHVPDARGGRVAPGHPDRPQPVHPVRPLRPGLPRPGRQGSVRLRQSRAAQGAGRQRGRPAWRTPTPTSPTRRSTSARSARSSRNAPATRFPSGRGSTITSRSALRSRASGASRGKRSMAKPKVATTSLAGCFGCHMSLLDIDERILESHRAGSIRQVADRRHQDAHGSVPGRPDRGRLLQRRERPRAAGVPHALRHPRRCRRVRDHGRHPGAA